MSQGHEGDGEERPPGWAETFCSKCGYPHEMCKCPENPIRDKQTTHKGESSQNGHGKPQESTR